MPIDIQPEDSAVFARIKSNGRITPHLRRIIVQQWNRCTRCKQVSAPGRPLFAGYDALSLPMLACATCTIDMSQLATPVYWSDTLDLSAEDNLAVWRFMDLAKFIAMLQQRGIFLPRADRLGDAFEAATGLSNRQKQWDDHYLNYFRRLVVSPPPGIAAPEYSDEQIEIEAQRLLHSIKSITSQARQLLVSCWHQNESESEALWRIYAPPPVSGVAIRSSVGKLWDACVDHRDAIVGRVHYVDFKTTFASIQRERIFQKRRSLSHEREIRLVLSNDKIEPLDGFLLACDLEELISEVVISPFAPNWLHEVVAGTIRKFGFSFPVRQSEILDQPFF